jgi:hypothetical protein
VRLPGLGVQGLGGLDEPAVQLNSTELLYPFTAVTVPLKVAVVPGQKRCERSVRKPRFEIRRSEQIELPHAAAVGGSAQQLLPAGVEERERSHGYVGQESNCWLLELGPTSIHAAPDVALWKTPTSVPT